MKDSSKDAHLLLDNQVCFSLYSASNAMSRAYQPMLKALDLTYLQYIVMMILWEEKSMNVKELGQKTRLDSGTLTPLLKRLEVKGFVTRTRSQEDERIRIIALTEQGLLLREQAQDIPSNMLCMSKMDIEQLKQLKQDCDQLLNNLTN